MIKQIQSYFPELSHHQAEQLSALKGIYMDWNKKINIISRKDIDNIEIHHILHSLSIAAVFSFRKGIRIMDAGTGGGFPGIPLAIVFPDVEFTLVDSIAKKIMVVNAIKIELGLQNIFPCHSRLEDVRGQFDFITGRAIAPLPELIKLVAGKIKSDRMQDQSTGLIYLKGGDFKEELRSIRAESRIYHLNEYFKEPFFETKKLVHLFHLQ